MNDLFQSAGMQSWKPVLAALLLPPVPWLLLVLVGARLIPWRRFFGWLLILLSVVGLWLSACSGVGEWMGRSMLTSTGPLTGERLAEFKKAGAAGRSAAIVILGGGREARAPEYGVSSLTPASLERLRYGVWLSRETGAPMLFSGGVGHASEPGTAEADVAADIAQKEFLRPLRWVENQARDTRENATLSTRMLREQGIAKIMLVTHASHMPRALRAFREAAAREGVKWEVVPAPMGLAPAQERSALRWLPSGEGLQSVRTVLREKLGWYLGA